MTAATAPLPPALQQLKDQFREQMRSRLECQKREFEARKSHIRTTILAAIAASVGPATLLTYLSEKLLEAEIEAIAQSQSDRILTAWFALPDHARIGIRLSWIQPDLCTRFGWSNDNDWRIDGRDGCCVADLGEALHLADLAVDDNAIPF